MIRNFPLFCSSLIGWDSISSNVPQSEYIANGLRRSIQESELTAYPGSQISSQRKGALFQGLYTKRSCSLELFPNVQSLCRIPDNLIEKYHCVPRAPASEVLSRLYLFTYCLKTYKTMQFTRFHQLSLNVTLRQWRNRVKCIVW